MLESVCSKSGLGTPVADDIAGQGGCSGSPFGHRSDPIAGLRAMHEGNRFQCRSGTPVVVAADGVVLSANYHADFGNVIGVDHGDGLTTALCPPVR
jgi:murein DD-endopeptidase MepM/ murein hydrolase activator NlpD